MANTLGDNPIDSIMTIARGGTSSYTYTNSELIRMNSGGTAFESAGVTASQVHDQNTDTGTTSTTFHLDSDNTGPILKNESGDLAIRVSGDSDYGNLICENLTVKGTQTIIESETMHVYDTEIILNADYSGGTPSDNCAVEVERGTLTNAKLLWNESNDVWQCGLSASEVTIATVAGADTQVLFNAYFFFRRRG